MTSHNLLIGGSTAIVSPPGVESSGPFIASGDAQLAGGAVAPPINANCGGLLVLRVGLLQLSSYLN